MPGPETLSGCDDEQGYRGEDRGRMSFGEEKKEVDNFWNVNKEYILVLKKAKRKFSTKNAWKITTITITTTSSINEDQWRSLPEPSSNLWLIHFLCAKTRIDIWVLKAVHCGNKDQELRCQLSSHKSLLTSSHDSSHNILLKFIWVKFLSSESSHQHLNFYTAVCFTKSSSSDTSNLLSFILATPMLITLPTLRNKNKHQQK